MTHHGRQTVVSGIRFMRTLPTANRTLRVRVRPFALILALATLDRGAIAQEPTVPGSLPPLPTTIGGFAPRLPTPPPPRDVAATSSFIDGLGQSTSTIELKVGQGRFLSLKEDLAVPGRTAPFVAVGDPTVADFFQVGPRQLRLIGKKLGVTDLSVTTGSGQTYDFEIQVVADLDVLRAQLRQIFPDASLKLAQMRTRVVVEGQARDAGQVSRIISTINNYLTTVQSIQVPGVVGNAQGIVQAVDPNAPPLAQVPAFGPAAPPGSGGQGNPNPGFGAGAGGLGQLGGGGIASPGAIATNQIATGQLQVINLIRVPTSQQVLLKVRVAELNRTAMRQIGADFSATVPGAQALFGSQIAGNSLSQGLSIGSQGTFYGKFGKENNFIFVLNALRKNNIVKILAEPNLVSLNGYQAAFLAGGEFPIPSFSGVGAGGTSGGGTSSTQFKQFGVHLSFLPIILDNDTIRLSVNPEVSSVDFSVATTLVPGGSPVPGLNTRSAYTTVELKQGETLAIAGLLQLTLDNTTQRLPGLGDLPYIGAFFSNTTGSRIEKELVVTVTPYIVEPMAPGQVPPGPGDEVNEPNDLEFFFLNRIEGRTGIDKRSTTAYDDPFHLIRHSIVEKKYLVGPSGYSN